MVVIAIVAILAAVAAPAYNEYIKKAKIGATVQIVGNAADKIKEYYDRNGVMPTKMSQIGYASEDSNFPEAFLVIPPSATTVNDYAVPPYLYSFGFGGSNESPGQCAQFAIGSVISNYDGSGALTVSKPGANYFFLYQTYVRTRDGIWQTVCQGYEPSNITTGDQVGLVDNCYNLATGGGNDLLTALIASCP